MTFRSCLLLYYALRLAFLRLGVQKNPGRLLGILTHNSNLSVLMAFGHLPNILVPQRHFPRIHPCMIVFQVTLRIRNRVGVAQSALTSRKRFFHTRFRHSLALSASCVTIAFPLIRLFENFALFSLPPAPPELDG